MFFCECHSRLGSSGEVGSRVEMSEGRIMLLAALPLLCGGAWMLGLRRPETAFAAAAQHGSATVAKQPPSGNPPGEGAHDYLGVIVAGYTADVGAEVGGS